jgi:hypothetical protein
MNQSNSNVPSAITSFVNGQNNPLNISGFNDCPKRGAGYDGNDEGANTTKMNK